MKSRKIPKWLTIGLLMIAAAALTMAEEAVQNLIMPPIYQGEEVQLVNLTMEQLEACGTYRHASGRIAYHEPWNLRRSLVTFAVQLAILTLLFPLGMGKRFLRAVKTAFESIREALKDRKNVLIKALLFLCVTFIGGILIRLWAMDALARSNWMIDVFSLTAGIALGITAVCRKTAAMKPEIIFVCLTLLIGSLFAFFMPDKRQMSWDDEYHYQHAVNFSYLGRVRFTEQEMIAADTESDSFNYRLDGSRDGFLADQDEKHEKGAAYATGGCSLKYQEFWLAWHGLGLFLGRLFHVRFWTYWSLGRFTGLLGYVLVGYFAIRRLKSGKMMLAAVLMLPQQIFLASSYSYDPGVTSLTALGMAAFFAQWQEKDRKITLSDQLVILGALFLGCLAKQTYFPVLLIPLTLPRRKFAGDREWKRFIRTNLAAVTALILSFALPFVLGDGAGDARGGENTNAFEQVRFILGHPLDYTHTLLQTLGQYFHPDHAREFINHLAYLGYGPHALIYLMLMTAVAFTDKAEIDQALGSKIGIRTVSLMMLFGAIVLAATALYVSYTTVGLNRIDGFQHRYLTPVIFPAMMLLGSAGIQNQLNRKIYNPLVFGIAGFVGFAAALHCCIGLYG